MTKILFSAFIFILIAYIDGSEVFKTKDPKKIAAYSLTLLAAGVIGLLLLMDVKIPNPIEPVQVFIVSIFGES